MVKQMANPDFKGFVLLSEDVTKAKYFYEVLLGQEVEMDFGGINIGFKGGLGLWQKEYAQNLIFGKRLITPETQNDVELYFEIADLETLFENLQSAGVNIIHPIRTAPWQQRGFRVYDPDNFIVEISESMPDVIIRLHKEGLTATEIIEKSMMPAEVVEAVINSLL